MNRRIHSVIRGACLAVTVACFVSLVGQRAASQESAQTDGGGEYDLAKGAKGKIVYLTLKQGDGATGDSYTVFLVKAKTARLGGSLLIVGKGYAAEDEEDAWYKDMTIGVAWENVMAFHIMTEKQYEAFIEEPAESEDSQAALERRIR